MSALPRNFSRYNFEENYSHLFISYPYYLFYWSHKKLRSLETHKIILFEKIVFTRLNHKILTHIFFNFQINF